MDEQPASILERKLEWESVDNKPAPEITETVAASAAPKPTALPAEPAQDAYKHPYIPPEKPIQGWYGQFEKMMKSDS